MEGDRVGPGRGIIPRAIEDVFADIQRDTHGQQHCKFLVRASYLQVRCCGQAVGGMLWAGVCQLLPVGLA